MTSSRAFHRLTLLGVVLTPIASATAQAPLTIPDSAATAAGNSIHALPFGISGFRTQLLVEASAVAANGAAITGIHFRSNRGVQTAASIPNVTVTISQTTQTLAGVSTTFANNVTATPTVVFQGTVDLPGYTQGGLSPRAWDVQIPFTAPIMFDPTQGNLLLDIRADNPNLPTDIPRYWADAAEPGGGTSQFGQSGPLSSFDTVMLTAGGTSLSSWFGMPPLDLTIGHDIDFVTELFAQPLPGLLALSSTHLAQPIDLTSLGAPDNELYIAPEVLTPLFWNPTQFGTQAAVVGLSVPTAPSLIGARIYGQSALIEPGSNALGLVLSNAVELRIGDANETAKVRQIDAAEAADADGYVLDFTDPWSTSNRFGAVVFQLDGVFF